MVVSHKEYLKLLKIMSAIIKAFYLLFSNPIRLTVIFLIKTLPNLILKKKFFYIKKIKNKIFLLSFDCDTQKDINYLGTLLSKLKDNKIKIVLAIPGELIERNLKLIIDLNKKYEIEFLNHGYHIHTDFNEIEKIYYPTFSYEEKEIKFIKEDIILAHNLFKDKLNINVKGFRAPHFGEISYKKKKTIFKYLKKIGYEYSSSSIYDLAFFKGPIFDLGGITEITVTGCPDNQSFMLDSWSFLKNENKEINLDERYFLELDKLIKLINEKEFNFINIYADPSHIIKSDRFFSLIKKMSEYNVYEFKEIKKLMI